MGREIKITKQTHIQSCNICGAANYNSEVTNTKKEVDYLNEISISGMGSVLCNKCCDKLIEKLIKHREESKDD